MIDGAAINPIVHHEGKGETWTHRPRRVKRARLPTPEFPFVLSRSRSRRAVLAGVAGLVSLSQQAAAHAILEDSEPAAGASIHPGTIVLKLRFNSRIDRTRSGLTMTRPDLTKVSVPIDPEGSPAILTATVTVTPGAYVLRWQVLAIDGHITRGDVPFTVVEH